MWAIQVALALCLLAPSAGHFFEDGYSHHYTYRADNSLFDQHNVTTILKFHINAVNVTEEGHRVHSLHVDSLVQYVKDGALLNNPMHWDLTKTFLFVSGDSGQIRVVHCHPEDHEELLIIKKAMVSIFSVHMQIEEDKDKWSYTADERDHLGALSHQYTAQRTNTGLKLHRQHYSAEEAFRTHEKMLHYDHGGTLQEALATDHVLVRDRSPKQKPSVLPGEKPHKVVSSGDFPAIQASATVKVTLDGKRLNQQKKAEVFHNLTAQTLETKPKPKPSQSLEEVRQNISMVFQCLKQYPQPDNENRSICINDLRSILRSLHKQDYIQFVNGHLGNRCRGNDTSCEDRRLVLIDVVSRLGDVTSQELLVTHVLTKEPAVGEELRRVFIHAVALDRPTEAFILALEKLCFGARGEHEGSRNLTRSQSRACLAVGGVARRCVGSGQHATADRLVSRLETWLDLHAAGDHHVSKRDTWLEETEHEDHHMSKAILLHALGNAALPRSRRHLLLHATPNRGHQLWRRAALDAMRHYNCTETIQSLQAAMEQDEQHTVRQTALSVYVKHPRRHEVYRDYENDLLSTNYTYPSVARVKRSVFDKILARFSVALPTLDWKKELGSQAVGASFGLYFENGIDGVFRVLDGQVKVAVHDKVWAEIHLGIISKKWDILLAEVCYKGQLSYNLNIMKNFLKGKSEAAASAFDKIAGNIVEPIEKIVNDLSSKFQDVVTNQPRSGFALLAQSVQELPEKARQALQSTVDLSQAADSMSGLPYLSKLQQLATSAQALMEDVQTEATDLFSNIKEAAVVALPFAEKEIRTTLNTVLGKLGKVKDNPRQVFASVERSKMSFHLAMQRILESSLVIKQDTVSFSGSRSSFMNAGRELSELAESARHLIQRLRGKGQAADTWTDTEEHLGTQMDAKLQKLLSAVEAMSTQIDAMKDGAKDLQAGLDKQSQYIDVLKDGYQAFTQAIDMAQSRISAVFGQKFHPKFPNETRTCDSRCGCGYYPTNTGRYGHPGVDLKLAPTKEIVSPVAGLAKPAGKNSVSIEPATATFKQYVIILSNIVLSVQLSNDGTFVDAGQVLGTPAGQNGCDISHFNVAVKRVGSDSNPSQQSYFVDPFPFLDIPQPATGWHQECRDFTFKHIGNVVDFSKLTSNLASVFEELQRFALSVGRGLLMKVINKLPDTGLLGPLKSIASDIVQNIDLNAGSLKNLFSKGKGPMKNFFKNISAKKFNLKGLLNMTRNKLGTTLRNSLRNVTSLIVKAKNFIRNPPLGTLKSLAMGSVGRILASRDVLCARSVTVDLDKMEIRGCGGSVLESVKEASTGLLESLLGDSGSSNRSLGVLGKFASKAVSEGIPQLASFVAGRVGMVSALKTSGCSVCPELGSALARVSGGTCLAHEDCLGMDCDVQFQNTLTKIQVSLKVKADPQQHQVTLEVNGQVQVLSGNLTKTVEKKIGQFTVRMKVRMSWQGTELQFTLSLEACVVGRCLPEVTIVRNVKLVAAATRSRRALREASCRKPMLDYLDTQPLDHLGKTFADTNLPTNSTNQQINGIQGQISSALKPSEEHAQPEMTAEFLNPKDYLSSGKFPIVGENGDLYIPFFAFMYAYPVGPLVLRMDFDAGGAVGLENKMKVRALDSMLQETIKPWVSGKFRASFSVSIVVASAGIDLIGWVMKTGFPLSIKTNFTQFPVISTKTLELELIPIELKLKLWASILFIFNFKKTIWHYTAPAIRTTLWEKVHRTEDKDAPQFVQPGTARRHIRSAGQGCTVYQVKGGHPKAPAFKLEFVVKDDNSALELSYAVGNYPGGTNVQPWTKLSSSLQSPAEFPCGIPLYFLVKARNTQGLEATASCSLPTFDCTFPDGRLDAAYRCSSHPSTLKSMVVMYEDSELQTDSLFHGVGYSPSSYGHEVVNWQALTLQNSQPRPGVSGDLRHFGVPRSGRLSSNPKQTTEAASAASCASQCVHMSTCVTFVYNKYLRRCELHQVTEGPNAERIPNDHYETYERLGKSYTATLRYDNLELRHGTRYYVNADVKNVLGYRATLSSQGTMIDRTPPEPGPVGKVKSDRLTAEGCGVSILQRCVEHVAGSLNHRRVVDGDDSTAIFNGNRKGQQMGFTIENYHAAGNWLGFKDAECGIHGYTWAVGRSVCGQDVVSFVDPHALIHNPQDWTYTGLAKGLHLADGAYYVSVQAVNDVIHGGDLVTTVCHSTPFVVDTTPPQFHAVQEFLFDESFRFLVVYYNVSDAISGVGRMEFGLGKTKYDVMIRRYLPMEMRGVKGNTYLVNEEFETQDGVPAWIRLKVVNKVGLAATGSSIAPILIDSSPPIAGAVLDGKDLGQDKCCQMFTTEICAQWVDFHDPDSNIGSFDWGVGLSPGKDDVLQFHTLSAYSKQSCKQMTLQHNVTYFSTVVANNKALNTKSANASSDGLLIDITPPLPGKVSDGSDVTHDVNFTSETATVTTSWADFYDGESGLADYGVSVMVNGNLEKTFKGVNSKLEVFADHSFSLKHKDTVVVQLQANNRAGGSVTVATDGMLVDHSPPEMLHISSQNRSQYQLRDDGLDFVWNFTDPESGVGEYRCVIFQLYQGRKSKFWPQLSDYHPIRLNVSTPTDEKLNLDSLSLQNGASYSIQVTAVNRARMATTHESKPVIVDTTPPAILSVTLTKPGEEEETNEKGVVEHVDQEPLWVSWSPHDTESDIKTSHVCIGPAGSPGCLSSNQYQTVDATSSPATLSFSNLNLQVSTEEKEVRYQAYIITFNNAGAKSTVAASKPFLVLKANIAGAVLDGRGTEDVDFSNDKASIAISFSGFSSAACGVVGYEWGVGTSPFATDVLPYTEYGLVVDDASKGFAQIHIMQTEGQKYYSTVRARTGARCHEPYIVSSSDGFTLDTTPPTAAFRVGERKVMSEEVVYQTTSNHLDVLWKATDASGVRETRLVQDFFGSSPDVSSVPAVVEEAVSLKRNPSSGDSLFSALLLTDGAGNERTVRLPPVVWDATPPVFLRLNCSKAVSALYPLLHCSWDTVREPHSRLSKILIGLGNGPSVANLMNMTTVQIHKNKWSYDVHHLFGASKVKYFYVIVQAINAAGLKTEKALKVLNDVSPPTVDDIIVVTSPGSGFHDVKQRCQTPQDYMEVLVRNLSDPESDLRSVEFALGTSKGRSDVVPFRKCRIVNGIYILENLSLSPGAIIYVTARITNTVGLYVIVTSDAVVISPEPRLEVSDGQGEADTDGQFDVHMLQGRWRYTDPCPVLEALWSVRERDGQGVIKFTPIDPTGNLFYNDGLHLQNFKTYVNHIRITDALNRTREAFSDGVTVSIRLPDTASVRDGLGSTDMDFQRDTETLSANWDTFGNPLSTLPSDQIIKYAAAVGTDRSQSTTRSDVHGFEDIALSTNITFYGLNLTAKTQTYYVTVRAYSAAESFVESSSDGIRVGFTGTITPGKVKVSGYQSSISSIRFSWSGFDSDMEITHYYAGVSSFALPLWDNETHTCSQYMKNLSSVLDVKSLQALNEDTMAVLDGLSLKHGASYYITVLAADEMGHCAAAGSEPIVVDTTPPVQGKVRAEGYDAGTVIFLHDPSTLTVFLEDLADPQSGVETVTVQLVSSTSCDSDSTGSLQTLIRKVEAKNQTTVSMRNLDLKEKVVYFLRVSVTNRASLTTEGSSLPLLLDTTPPAAGLVKLGKDWTGEDQTFLRHKDTVTGLVALQSSSSAQACVTQEDLMREDARKSWKPVQGNFTTQCVQFDPAGLHVMVQHNPYLTGVDKGAIQYESLAWREGDYTFSLIPAVSRNIQSGVSLGSPSLQPPFSAQNDFCDPSNTSCAEDRNQTVKSGSLSTNAEYGIGLTFYTMGNSLRLLFWAQDFLQLKQTLIPLDFDPATVAASYTFRLRKRQEGGNPLWEVTVLVREKTVTSVSGLSLPDNFVVTVYGWNVDNYFPQFVSEFEPFRNVTVVKGVSIPVATRPLCSYGSAFRDSTSDVKEVWVGVSDGYNKTSNVANYTLLKSFCLPCLHQCSRICSTCTGDRLTNTFLVMPLVLQGLNLQAGDVFLANTSAGKDTEEAKQAEKFTSWGNNTDLHQSTKEYKQYQLPTYYLDVRVVDHSGLDTHVKSVGFVVDTSPPAFKSVVCFNPAFSADVAIVELGNKNTVGVTWEVAEDASSVKEVQVYLGTQPGSDDIVTKQTVAKDQNKHVFAGLLLAEGKLYYVTVEAENTAGLRSKASSNFTVRTSKPDLSQAKVRMENVTAVSVGNVTVGLTESINNLELDVDLGASLPGSSEVEYYELAIGTAGVGKDDVFPKTVVGNKGTKRISIIGGFVWRKEAPAPISLGDYTKKNMSSDDRPDSSANLFSMEPGRCLDIKVFAATKAHVDASMDRLVCLKRAGDVMLTADRKRHSLQLTPSGFSTDPAHSDPTAYRVVSNLKKGVLLVGVLTDSDTKKQFGSSASDDFSPFVVSPDVNNQTSRWLRQRLKAIHGPNVFLSPVAEAEFEEDTEVIYTVPPSVHVPADSQVALLIYNPVSKEWEGPEEVCSITAQTYNSGTRVLTAKLCPKLFSQAPRSGARRKKRSTTSDGSPSPPVFSFGPRMLTVAVITSSVPNQPPTVHNTSITLVEDSGMYNFTLTYTDPEGDDMTFWVSRQPDHGTAQVTPDGKISYRPNGNYTGKDTIYVQGKEVLTAAQQALGMVPHVVSFQISVSVTDVNDPPDIFYVPRANSKELQQEVAVGPTAGNGLNMTVYREANATSSPSSNSSSPVVLGLVVFSDVDVNDIVHYSSAKKLDAGVDFTESDVPSDDARLSGLNLTSSTGNSGKEISLSLTPQYTGHVQYHARVKDAAGSYSLQLTLNVFVLLNPCVYGVCQPRSSLDSCYEPRRAFTFDPYRCQCEKGYEGEWCQTETDECRTATCSPITDCVDLIGEYRCDVNTEKMAAIIVCCVLAVGLVAVAIYKLKKRSSKVDPLKGSDDLVKPSPSEGTSTPDPTLSSPDHLKDTDLNPSFQFLQNPLFMFKPRPNPTATRPSDMLNTSGDIESTMTTVKASVPASTAMPRRKPKASVKSPTKAKALLKKVTVQPTKQTSQTELKGPRTLEVKTKAETVAKPGSVDDVNTRPTSSSSTQSHYVITGATVKSSITDVN